MTLVFFLRVASFDIFYVTFISRFSFFSCNIFLLTAADFFKNFLRPKFVFIILYKPMKSIMEEFLIIWKSNSCSCWLSVFLSAANSVRLSIMMGVFLFWLRLSHFSNFWLFFLKPKQLQTGLKCALEQPQKNKSQNEVEIKLTDYI